MSRPSYKGTSRDTKTKFVDYCKRNNVKACIVLDKAIEEYLEKRDLSSCEDNSCTASETVCYLEQSLEVIRKKLMKAEEDQLKSLFEGMRRKDRYCTAINKILHYIFGMNEEEYISQRTKSMSYDGLINCFPHIIEEIKDRLKLQQLSTEQCLLFCFEGNLSMKGYDNLKKLLSSWGYNILVNSHDVSMLQCWYFEELGKIMELKATSSVGCSVNPEMVLRLLNHIDSTLESYECIFRHDGYPLES